MSTHTTQKRYLTCAETAQLVRKALRTEFPGVKFSVRSDTYAGGASIRVRWTDGPTSSDVDRIAGAFAGADFDGMVDLKVYAEHWLHPDGSVSIAHRPGTTGSFMEIIGDPIGPTAELVDFGADYVFCNREISPEWQEEILEEFERVIGRPIAREELWRQEIPLAVDRDGRVLRMVDRETEAVPSLVLQYTGTRVRG